MPMQRIRREWPALLSIAVIVPIGFNSKAYRGPAAHWVNDSLGGVFYVIFWCLVISLLLPRVRAARITLAVLAGTCTLEFLQRWHPPFLEYLRSFFIGRTILGSYFDWYDFPYYFAGALLGWLWLRALGKP
jgi:hypothetical protein